jgi:hypothetical protein
MSATYPLDMVRGRLTIQEKTNQQYRGIAHAARTIIAQEGALALYKGWLPSVIGVVPYVGLNFAVYESSKVALMKHHGAACSTCPPFDASCFGVDQYTFHISCRRIGHGPRLS